MYKNERKERYGLPVMAMKLSFKLCLLSYDLSIKKQQEFKKIGIAGYCSKGIITEELVANFF